MFSSYIKYFYIGEPALFVNTGFVVRNCSDTTRFDN